VRTKSNPSLWLYQISADHEYKAGILHDADDDGAASAWAALFFVNKIVRAAATAAKSVNARFGLVFVATVGKRIQLTRSDGDIAHPVAAAAEASVY
jgi:hypothetical protein